MSCDKHRPKCIPWFLSSDSKVGKILHLASLPGLDKRSLGFGYHVRGKCKRSWVSFSFFWGSPLSKVIHFFGAASLPVGCPFRLLVWTSWQWRIQETGIPKWVARSVSGDMGTKTCGLPLLVNFEPPILAHESTSLGHSEVRRM